MQQKIRLKRWKNEGKKADVHHLKCSEPKPLKNPAVVPVLEKSVKYLKHKKRNLSINNTVEWIQVL